MMLPDLKKVAGIVIVLSTIIGAAWALDTRWAYRKDFAELGKSFQRYQIEQSIDKTTDRIWSTEDRLKKDQENEELQRQKRELEERKRRLEMQLQTIDEK
jgi:predicted outer membrane protein